MVDDFARRLKPKKGQYVFAVADCGGTQGKTLVQLRNRLRANGSGLDAGFAVRGDFFAQLPGMRTSGIIRFIRRIAKRMPVRFGDRSNEIVRTVSDKAEHKPETNNWPVNLIGSLIHGGAMRMFNKIDADFSVGDACTSCGTCARVCPRENVKLVDGKPTWHHDCESCFACFLWCPEKAIAFKGFPPNEPTHHPDIIVVDMLLR